MRKIFIILCVAVGSLARAAGAAEDLGRLYSPQIVDGRLVIKGVIDSHIYDYIKREQARLKDVKVVELNSFGGNVDWGMEVAEEIRAMNLTTWVPEGNVCASICVALFAAGTERVLGEAGWLGVHGVRLGAQDRTKFYGACFIQYEDETIFEPRLRGCSPFLEDAYARTYKRTMEVFGFIESMGVSDQFAEIYFAKPEDPEWPQKANVLRIQDWEIKAPEALELKLATRLKL